MAHALRDRNTPKALAQGRQVIDFEGRLADFEGLCGIVGRDLAALEAAERPADWQNARLTAKLEFGFLDLGEALPAVTGCAEVETVAVCQRCLEPCALPLRAELKYLLLPGERSVGPLPGYEVWELEEATFRPSELVEEALIMALPIAATHDDPSDCGPLANRPGPEEGADEGTALPFAGLRSLMDRTD